MLNNRSIGIRSLSLVVLMGLVTASFWGWLFIWEQSLFVDQQLLKRYLLYNEFLLIGILVGLGGKRRESGPHSEFVGAVRRSGRQSLLGLFAVFFVVFAVQDTGASRSFFFSYIPWLYITLLFANFMVPKCLAAIAFSGEREERVALVGTPGQAREFQPWLERKNSLGLRTLGLIYSQPLSAGLHPPTDLPFPILGRVEAIDQILKTTTISQLIVLDWTLGPAPLQNLTQLCEAAAVRLLVLHDLNNYFNHATTMFEDDGMRFVGLREEPLESPTSRFLKRITDLAIAVPVVILVLPGTTALVWLLQRLQSPGPIFHKQARNGMLGRPFQMYKYRTMRPDNSNQARQATKDDSRIYPAGRWMRKLSMDELPQFINVLRGDMSVVGPRPHLETHEELWVRVMGRYVIRRFIRPGITGWAQINGFRGEIHSEADIRQRVEADIHYLENWSFSLDCVIIVKTIKHCLFPPRSAY